MTRIEYVKWGLANNFGHTIEINEGLKEHPELLGPILQHEFNHTDKKFSWHDMKVDLTRTEKLSTMKLMKFMLRHPKTFTQFLPFYWTKKHGFVYDVNLIIIYVVIIGIILGGFTLGNVFN